MYLCCPTDDPLYANELKGLSVLNVIIQKIKNHYGSKHGLKNQWKYSVMTRFGDFERYRMVDFQQVKRFVFVCAGNICRSPLAEAVATHSGIKATSYGLHCRGGDQADPRAIRYASERGFNLQQHITKNIQAYKPQEGDLLVGMEPFHAMALESRYSDYPHITLIGLWLPSCKAYIHDPFNANDVFFNRCEDEITEATFALVSKLKG